MQRSVKIQLRHTMCGGQILLYDTAELQLTPSNIEWHFLLYAISGGNPKRADRESWQVEQSPTKTFCVKDKADHRPRVPATSPANVHGRHGPGSRLAATTKLLLAPFVARLGEDLPDEHLQG